MTVWYQKSANVFENVLESLPDDDKDTIYIIATAAFRCRNRLCAATQRSYKDLDVRQFSEDARFFFELCELLIFVFQGQHLHKFLHKFEPSLCKPYENVLTHYVVHDIQQAKSRGSLSISELGDQFVENKQSWIKDQIRHFSNHKEPDSMSKVLLF